MAAHFDSNEGEQQKEMEHRQQTVWQRKDIKQANL